jgi:hypothetical protein
MTEYEKTLQLLEELQSYLDNTETPSEALDNLYTEIVKAKKDINHEYVLYTCQSKWRESND